MTSYPKVAKIRQSFDRPQVTAIEQVVSEELDKEAIKCQIKPGASIAITAGSRGIANIALIIKEVIRQLKEKGANPFIVPAMGSHGGATAEGQVKVLNSLGITEEYSGAPIKSSMQTVQIGTTEEELPVYMDKNAYEADGVIVMGRIKPHTDFRATIESGICKMASIGLGKHDQALALHTLGIHGIRDVMPKAAKVIFDSGKVLFGIGIVENAYDETAIIEAIPTKNIFEREAELLQQASQFMPSLPVKNCDILFVDEIGKNFSGTGMDTNIIGRIRISGVQEPENPQIKYIIVGDVSDPSHGNALGIGLADLTTERLLNKINFQAMNENVITSTFLARASIPIVLKNDKGALEAAMRGNWGVNGEDTRFVRIPNTLEISTLYVSETVFEEIKDDNSIEVLEPPREIIFDDKGNFPNF
ncbi:lactate racemase domain-containing protein [Bacillus sp. FJAT-44742]|uniref:lactate racemase domain-containing protein n=1 Tax=Bacillus sp. FJAT-44742 TaxID=2014005 RepID=UPI000C232990|nr:lactate racemase domain-containing protein [Bacillus sp. FJAT-44742]